MIPKLRFEAVPRASLLELLQESGSRLALLQAPSGYGKTVLLTQFAYCQQKLGVVVYWCRLDPTRPDPLGMIAETLGAPQASPGESARWLEEWGSQLDTPTLLVVDALSLRGHESVLRALERLISLSPNLRVVASMPASTLVGRNETLPHWQVLTAVELEFLFEEVEALSAQLGVTDESTTLRTVSGFEGWPIGTRAALEASLGRGSIARMAEGIFWSPADDGARTLLSIMGSVEKLRVEALTPVLPELGEHAPLLLQQLVLSGCITQELDAVGEYFRVRPALRPYFQQLGWGMVTPSQLVELKAGHARVEEALDPVESLGVLLETGYLARAEQMSERNFGVLISGRERTLMALRLVPLEQLEEYPMLLIIRIILERPYQSIPVTLVERMAAHLYKRLSREKVPGTDRQFIRKATMQISVERMLGRWDSALLLSREVMQALENPRWGLSENKLTLSPITYSVIALAGLLGGVGDLATSASARGYELATALGNTFERVHALELSALSFAIRGEITRASRDLTEADALSLGQDWEYPEFSWVDGQLARLLVAVYTADFERAVQHLDRLLPHLHRMEQWPMVVMAESILLERMVGAEESLMRLNYRLQEQPPGVVLSDSWHVALGSRRADLATWIGRYQEAEASLKEVEPYVGSVTDDLLVHGISEARMHLFSGQYQLALESCERLGFWDSPWVFDASLDLIQALAHFDLEDYVSSAKFIESLEDSLYLAGFVALVESAPYELLYSAVRESGSAEFRALIEGLPEDRRKEQYGLLTKAELEVLTALSHGKSMLETAESLFISLNTLKTHRRSLYAKLRVSSRAEALNVAWKLGLI